MYKFVRSFKKKPQNEEKIQNESSHKTNENNQNESIANSDQNSSLKKSDSKSSLSTLTTSPKISHESFVKIRPNLENNKKTSSQSVKVKRSFSHQKKNSEKNQSVAYRSSSISSLTTLSSITKKNLSTSSSSSSSLTTSNETIVNTKIFLNDDENNLNNNKLIDKIEYLIRNESEKLDNKNANNFNRNNSKFLNLEVDFRNNTQNEGKIVNIIKRNFSIPTNSEFHREEKRAQSFKMVHSDKKQKNNVHLFSKPLYKTRIRNNLNLSSEEDEEKLKKNSKNVNFRILKIPQKNENISNGSFKVLAQQPNVQNKNSKNRIPVLITPVQKTNQHFVEISSGPRKRVRSPSNSHTRPCSAASRGDYNKLLNLAQRQSQKNRVLNKITIRPLPRSLSVNYLYRKRQGDLRRYQKNALIKISVNRPGFTTEDIDDIYMPKKFDMFKRKLMATLDVSDNSELEEGKMRQERLNRYTNCNKRIKQEIPRSVSRPKIIINYRISKPDEGQLLHEHYLNEKKSYLEEAKRKLDEMKNSKGYYYNLNNKLKSSVTNLIKASHDLARTNEIKSKFLMRNSSLREVYDVRRHQIRSNNLTNINSDSATNIQNSYTSDDLDNVYTPWMIENYGRKLTIEAMRRRANDKNENKASNKLPYVSQYYAKSSDFQSLRQNDLWLIDQEIRRYVKRNNSSSESDISMTDTETSSDDTRPIIPEKIKKPDNSLKNKILKAINKSLLSSEMTGIDLNILKLNDCVRRTLKRIEKRALERDLEHDLIRSFSCSHLADLRKEDIKYMNMRIRNTFYSYSTEDIEDLYIPRILENYKLKLAVEKERKSIRYPDIHFSRESLIEENLNEALVTSPPPVQIKSPTSIATPLSPNQFKTNTDSLFKQIIQERLSEFDYRIASEISSSTKRRSKAEEDTVSTDNDQDDSIEISSESDDLNINDDEMKNFDFKSQISKSKIESAINKSLKNPGELISDFYISNMNYAMRYSVEYIQQVSKELRQRRQQQDATLFNLDKENKLSNRRSSSVDRLYAVRKEHLRYSNGAEHQSRISFTTDDIQDIYMPFCLDNYKRKIAVELERRRRNAELSDEMEEFNDNLFPVKSFQPVILDDLDLFIIKKSKYTIQNSELDDKLIKQSQPTIQIDQQPVRQNFVRIENPPLIQIKPEKAFISTEEENRNRLNKVQINKINFKTNEDRIRFERANLSIQEKLSFFENYPIVTKTETVLDDEPMQIDQANVSYEHEVNNYPLINKINTIVDNELLQENLSTSSSSSMTSSITTESNDSLNNINLDAFEPKKNTNILNIDKATTTVVEEFSKSFVSKNKVLHSEQVPVLAKPIVNYEIQQLNKVNVNYIQPINMPTQKDEYTKAEYSNYLLPKSEIPQEINYTVISNELKSSYSKNKSSPVVLNAPNLTIENLKFFEAEKLQVADKSLNIKRPEYFIEEYVKKPLNSEITIPYENINFIEIERDDVEKAKIEREVNKFEKLDSKIRLRPLNAPKIDFDENKMSLADGIETKINAHNVQNVEFIPKLVLNEPASMLIPIDVKNAEQAHFEEFEIMEFKNEEKLENNAELNEEGFEMQLAHVTEYKNVENPIIDEFNLSDSDSLIVDHIDEMVLNEQKVKAEMIEPIKPIQNKVYSLPKHTIDTFELDLIEEFEAPKIEIDQLESVEKIEKLEICQQPKRLGVLSLARQDSIKSLENRSENFQSDQIVPENALEKHEILELNSKPLVQKTKPLNVALDEVKIIEEQMTEELEFKEDSQVQQSAFSQFKIDPLNRPLVSEKPFFLNKANLSESTLEQQTVDDLHAQITIENLELKEELEKLNSAQDLKADKSMKTFNLGTIRYEEVPLVGTNEYENEILDAETAMVNKEEGISQKIEQPSALDVLNAPTISKGIDEFLETVKPLDTIELDFEEQISINTRKSSLIGPNDIKISIRQSFHQPKEIDETLNTENCSDFNESDITEKITEPIYQENKIDILSPTGIKVDCVEKIGYGKVETPSLNSEEPIEFETSYYQTTENLKSNSESIRETDRLGTIKSQLIFNSPLTGQIKIETLEHFTTENIEYEKPDFIVQDSDLNKDQLVSKVQSLNAPDESYEILEEEYYSTEFHESYTEEEIRIQTENSSSNNCDLKVGIDQKVKYNLAELKENINREENNLELVRENLINLDTINPKLVEPSLLSHSGKDTTVTKVKKIALSKQIVEVIETHKTEEFEEKIEIFNQSANLGYEENSIKHKIQNQKLQVRNLETIEKTEYFECNNLSVNEFQQSKTSITNEPFYLVSEHNKSKLLVISKSKQDEIINSSCSSLDSLNSDALETSKAELKLIENLNKAEKIEGTRPYNSYLVNVTNEMNEDVGEFEESLQLENSILKASSDVINEKVIKENLDIFNLPNEQNLSDTDSEIEPLNEDLNSVLIQNPKLTTELREFEKVDKNSNQFLNAPAVQNISLNNSQNIDEFELENEPIREANIIIENENLNQSNQFKKSINILNAPKEDLMQISLENTQVLETPIPSEDTLISKIEVSSVSQQPIEKSKIKFLIAPRVDEAIIGLEQVDEIETKTLAQEPLEAKPETELVQNSALKSKIKFLNAPKIEEENLSFSEEAHSYSIDANLEQQINQIQSVQNEALETQAKKQLTVLNAPKVESDNYSDLEEADSFEIEFTSTNNLDLKLESHKLETGQLQSKILTLNAPTEQNESFSNFEEVENFESEIQNENFLEAKSQVLDLTTEQIKSKINLLNAPKELNESFSNFEKVETFESELRVETNLEPKLEAHFLNSETQLKSVITQLNAPKYENLSSSYLEDADSLEISKLEAENPIISEIQNHMTSSVIKQAVNLLNAPRPETTSLSPVEKVEDFEIKIETEQSQLIKIENDPINNAKSIKINALNAPRVDTVSQNLENLENFESERNHDYKLSFTCIESSTMDKVINNHRVNLLNAPDYRNISHSFIERAESFETKNEMHEIMIEKEELNLNYLSNIQEPVRVLMREMEDAIEYTFNEGAYRLENNSLSPESPEWHQENNFLNNKPDKKLLLWLNYPKIVKNENEQEEAKRLDEQLDYLYEKCIAGIKSNDSLEMDSNLVHCEKVLSLLISNQKHVEYHEELLRIIPNSRPELQRLVLNFQQKSDLEMPNKISAESQTDLRDLSFEEDSIEEMSTNTQSQKFQSNLQVQLDVRQRIKSSSRVVFNMANIKTFFDQDEKINQFSEIEPYEVKKTTHQVVLKAPNVTSLEQKLEHTWIVDEKGNSAEIPIFTDDKNWNQNEGYDKSDTDDDTGSFFEQIENFEIIEKVENKIHSTVIEENQINLDISIDSINEKMDREIESENDTDTTSVSESSAKMHLIESVEVLTHPGLHVHKVDINRMKIREKVKFNSNEDPKSRFKVNFKQEELLDLRENQDETLKVDTNREFAKKFVQQIINLSASKLELSLASSSEDENFCNLKCIASKDPDEILESLSNIKCDLTKHFADSLISEYGPETSLIDEQCLNMNLMEDEVSDRENFFENFSNRLHSSSNYGQVDEFNKQQIESDLEKSNYEDSKDKEVVEILAQIVKQRTSSNCSSDSEDSLENIKRTITLDSMQSFLDNVVNAAKNTVNSKIEDLSDQDDEISIQEMVIFNQKLLDEANEKKIINPKKYKINSIKIDTVDDLDKTSAHESADLKYEPINGAALIKTVEKSPEIHDFDETVEIVDSVVIDHVSEDDKSTTSEEVTFERWTEETKLIRTKIFKDGNLVDEIIERKSPELVDVLKRVRVKSPGQSRRQSLDIQEILNEDLDGSSIFIVEPTITSIKPSPNQDNTYLIQHQQVITPSGQRTSILKGTTKTSAYCSCFEKNALKSKNSLNQNHAHYVKPSPSNFSLSSMVTTNDHNNHFDTFYTETVGFSPCNNNSNALSTFLNKPKIKIQNLKDEEETRNDLKDSLENLNANKMSLETISNNNNNNNNNTSNINSYFDGIKAISLSDLSKDVDENVLIVRSDSFDSKSALMSNLNSVERVDNQMIEIQNQEAFLDNELINESYQDFKNKSDSIVSNTSDSFGSMQRFERPSKLELLKIQQEKQQQAFFYEDATSTTLESEKNDKTIEENSTFKQSEMSTKKEDLTDLSDYENNIFLNTDQNKSVSYVESRSSIGSEIGRRRNLPLRRESFELAQRDPTKRLSIAKSTTSSSSSSFGFNQIIIKPGETQVSNTQNNNNNNIKRLLSEIRPTNEQTDAESKTIDFQNESDSSESDILKRNYEILRKKTSEKIFKNELNESKNSDTQEQASFISSHSIKSENIKPSVRPTKIKIVKKQKLPSKDSNFSRSVSPGLLRGPDIIETIETTTSMSFIMNKNINLVTEEKVEKNSNLKTALSQPQLNKKSESDMEPIKSIPIPIQIQSRSKSEPKLKPENESREIKVTYRDDKKPRVTFHKYDSNEIIAVVNVPEALETKTVESVVENYEKNSHQETSHFSKSHSKSTPNLVEKLDCWKKWPEYTVDQETDTSNLSSTDYSHCWVKETPDSRVVFRNHQHKDKDPEFEIEIEKILPVHDYTRPNKNKNQGRYSTHSILHTENEQTIATRMSSGYFSGDEFKSQMLNYSPSYSASNFNESSPRTSSSQFNINKFLNSTTRSKPKKTSNPLEEFNKLYESLGLEQDETLLDRANERDYSSTCYTTKSSSIKKLISNNNEVENYDDYYYKKSVYSCKPARSDTFEDDLSPKTNQTLKRPTNLDKDDASVFNNLRKRSNSMSNLSNNDVILPSPTTADYLRNRTRESALINVVMKPAKTSTDFEISQILYDDMAYRQLRKDSEAHKLSQIKANQNIMPNNLTNITTLPISYVPKRNSVGEFYQSSGNVRTVKMIKQKDATNKNYKQNNLVYNRTPHDMENRYFTNESNPEINEYYDSLNHVKITNRNYGNY
ncbi:unnamed protein product [Brachionus calyciflorus]|uniref:Uncharacterized protein n=1 Tax=Brachionus calyciflorus TaxID=104777 RepID=A0A813MLN6_9BILA|nr:unnamed protein product [Brachionus calyciflorus]